MTLLLRNAWILAWALMFTACGGGAPDYKSVEDPVSSPRPVVESPEPDILEQLRLYPIAYEAPDKGVQSKPFSVTLAIDATGGYSAAQALPGTAVITEDEAQLTRQVQPTLSGSAFEITLTSPARQTLSSIATNVWRWDVTPRIEGSQTLNLEIYAYLDNGQSLPLKRYNGTVDVAVSAAEKTSWFAENLRLWISILGGIVSLILGSIALWAHFKRS